MIERPEEKAGAHEEHHAQRDLDENQHTPWPAPRRTGDGVAARFHERFPRFTRLGLKCRQQSEHDARDQRGSAAHGEDSQVEAHVSRDADRILQQRGGELRTGVAEREANDAADRGEHDALGEQLPHDCARPPPSAMRVAISGARVDARASNSPAMLTQPMSSTTPTAAHRMISGSAGCRRSDHAGGTRCRWTRSSRNISRNAGAPTVRTSVSAAAQVAPAFRRPMTV